ncbi:MAG TPA: hypothetical protein VLT87_01995 [Thermoanaerobaculia bacterium]|nr:hypothetical protein [Thermoanaerobaculia bacterium]
MASRKRGEEDTGTTGRERSGRDVKAPARGGSVEAERVSRRGVPQRPRPAAREEWQRDFQRFLRTWRREHPSRIGGDPERSKMARTFLHVTRTAETGDALDGLGLKGVPVIVENLGNVAAYTCVVRTFEARPRSPIHEKIPFAEFTLGGQLILNLQPGESRTIRVPFVRTREQGTFIVMISDPILDPNELTVADWTHRRILLVNLV